jgi:hypothetical protein
MCLRCEDRPLTKLEREQAEIYKAMTWGLLHGAQGLGKNYAAASKVRERVWASLTDADNHGASFWTEKTAKMPQKICNYRKRKLYWFGELHGSNNFVHNPSMQVSHWAGTRGMGARTGRFANADPLKGKRFIGISEPTETNQFDQDFLKKFTADEWVETRTLDVSSKTWVPQGKIFVSSGKPLKINDKSKEIIERVKGIEFPEAT